MGLGGHTTGYIPWLCNHDTSTTLVIHEPKACSNTSSGAHDAAAMQPCINNEAFPLIMSIRLMEKHTMSGISLFGGLVFSLLRKISKNPARP